MLLPGRLATLAAYPQEASTTAAFSARKPQSPTRDRAFRPGMRGGESRKQGGAGPALQNTAEAHRRVGQIDRTTARCAARYVQAASFGALYPIAWRLTLREELHEQLRAALLAPCLLLFSSSVSRTFHTDDLSLGEPFRFTPLIGLFRIGLLPLASIPFTPCPFSCGFMAFWRDAS